MRFPQDVPVLRDGTGDGTGNDEVTLRAHRDEDVDGVVEQCLDPVSRTWTTVPLDYTRADAVRFVRTIAHDAWVTDEEWMFAVEAPDAAGVRRFAGTISLRNERNGKAEVAFGAHPWVRGSGVMERAVRLLLTWGFEERGLRTVTWWANRGNWASRKLAWRLGFAFEGAPRQWLPQRGELLDAWVGTLLAGEPMRPRSRWLDVPRIEGERVVLRRPREDDLPRVVEYASDPGTARWLGFMPQPYGPDDARQWLRDAEDRLAAGTAVTWAVADPADDRLLGAVNLFALTPVGGAELGYVLHPEARGRGLAQEAAALALRHAWVPVEDGGLGLVRVRALVAEGNEASSRVLAGLGFDRQGVERRVMLVDGPSGGRLVDGVLHDVLAPVGGPHR